MLRRTVHALSILIRKKLQKLTISKLFLGNSRNLKNALKISEPWKSALNDRVLKIFGRKKFWKRQRKKNSSPFQHSLVIQERALANEKLGFHPPSDYWPTSVAYRGGIIVVHRHSFPPRPSINSAKNSRRKSNYGASHRSNGTGGGMRDKGQAVNARHN